MINQWDVTLFERGNVPKKAESATCQLGTVLHKPLFPDSCVVINPLARPVTTRPHPFRSNMFAIALGRIETPSSDHIFAPYR